MRVLITGASFGIGREMAKVFYKKGWSLVLCARSETALFELKNELENGLEKNLQKQQTVEILVADLSKREEVFSLYEKTGEIDALVNNAGFGVFGEFTTTDLQKERQMIDLNIVAVHILTKLFLRDFTAKNSGYILNVASIAAFFPGPVFAGYYASKAYVLRLTRALRAELKAAKSDVYVGALCPGPVKTNFNAVSGAEFAVSGLEADFVARYGVEKMLAKKGIIVPGFLMKLTRFFAAILPETLTEKAVLLVQKGRKK